MPLLISATLGTLTVLTIILMRDRSSRDKSQSQLSQLLLQFSDPLPESLFSHDIDETPLLQEAEREIWMIQETGHFALETKKTQIISFLQRGGTLKIVVVAPTRELLSLLAFRNHSLTLDAIKIRSNSFYHQVESILESVGTNAEGLQVRFTPYPVEITCTLIDPRNDVIKKREAIVRYAGFRVPYDQKLGYSLRGDTSSKIFSHYFREAKLLFECASKIILLTGEPRSGKTTVMTKLVESLSSESRSLVFFAISRATLSGNKRTGFEVITSGNPKPRSFATRQSNGSYNIDTTIWASVSLELEEAYKERKIVIIDEIGPMQLQSATFIHTIEKLLNDPLTTMFATIALEDHTNTTLKKIKQHYRSTVFKLTLNKNVRTEIENDLEQEMKGSIYMVRRIPQTLYEYM